MATSMSKAQELIFGRDGFGATNFKLFPGSSRDATPEEVAHAIESALLSTDGEEVDVDLAD